MLGLTVRTHARRVLAVSILAAALVAAFASGAWALSISVPANVPDRMDVSASLTASDHAGLLLLYLDNALVRSVAASDGPVTATFAGVPVAAGTHRVRVALRNSEGLTTVPPKTVVSWRKPLPPTLVSPAGGYAALNTSIVAKAGPGTTKLRLLLNGKAISTKNASPGQLVNMGGIKLAAGLNTIVIEASNPIATSSGTFKIRRLDFPWPTCIVVDKSEFKLYWVKDGVLVKTYPVAIGKSHTPTPERTWRVGEKYVYTYWGIYGPRRLRLYKQSGSSFYYSPYGIHGTNQEWVIGTMASHGCIRMYNKDILDLFPRVPLYTMVQTRY